MRELAKSMECNQKLINRLGYSCRGRGSSLFDKWTSIRDYETAKKMLSETTIENIAWPDPYEKARVLSAVSADFPALLHHPFQAYPPEQPAL